MSIQALLIAVAAKKVMTSLPFYLLIEADEGLRRERASFFPMLEAIKHWTDNPTVEKLTSALAGVVLVWIVARVLIRSVERYVVESTLRYRVRKAVALLAYFATVLVLATTFSAKLAGLTVAFGVAGAGIAFALQEVIASIAGWVAISFGNFYTTGDRVQVGGIKGDVIDIGILRTTVMELGQWISADMYNGRIVRIANSSVFKDPVFNYSADFPFLWDEITLPVRYGSDWKLARKMLAAVAEEVCQDFAMQSHAAWQEAVRRYRLEETSLDPLVTLVANDNWVELTLRYIVGYRQRRATKSQLFTRILEEIERSEDRIRIASTTSELVNFPKFDVSFGEGKGVVRATYVP